ncbi:zinc-dependent peptidase [Luteirhabdus pelagi]|uniref:zinc-dependent peptidase n=1 Tax=Luteirhabdus pelagi TaxID=2792783 RepID=UPI00193A2595|nr:zinc-dependent peptidase [Luteirhabdus pelagi]
MVKFLLQESETAWLAPYAYTIVLLGFAFFLFRVFENWYAGKFSKPLIRHYLSYRKLSYPRQLVLEKELRFYNQLSPKHKMQFQHRVATFIKEKNFVGRQGLEVTDRMKTLIAGIGCMLSFGRKNYLYSLIEHILLYPNEFYSTVNDAEHKGEFNPRERAMVLSWADFEKGYEIDNDNINLGIHEFMHAMQLEAKKSRDLDSNRFQTEFQNILKRLTHQKVKDTLDKTRFFRAYAFTNEFEFMAVLAEYFIESPEEFQSHFPQLFEHMRKLLNFRFAGY